MKGVLLTWWIPALEELGWSFELDSSSTPPLGSVLTNQVLGRAPVLTSEQGPQ